MNRPLTRPSGGRVVLSEHVVHTAAWASVAMPIRLARATALRQYAREQSDKRTEQARWRSRRAIRLARALSRRYFTIRISDTYLAVSKGLLVDWLVERVIRKDDIVAYPVNRAWQRKKVTT